MTKILQCFLLKETTFIIGQRMIQLFILSNVNATSNKENHDPDTIVEMNFWYDETDANYVVKKVVNL